MYVSAALKSFMDEAAWTPQSGESDVSLKDAVDSCKAYVAPNDGNM
jgi:hypothetical protein